MSYQIGEILVFVGGVSRFEGEVSHSRHFSKSHHYKIVGKENIDYESDSIDTSYGTEVLYFENCDYGCYTTFAKKFFMKLEDYRTSKINNILND